MPKRLIPIVVAHEHPGSELTPDEVEFGLAMEAYQRRYHRRYPSWSEVLYVLRQLGYHRDSARADADFAKRLVRVNRSPESESESIPNARGNVTNGD